MSLVGNLEDLSLGDILQIISLSQKSGVLALASDLGSGRIVFRQGLVQAACLKGAPNDLRELLVARQAIDATAYDSAEALAEQIGVPVERTLASEAGLPAERIESWIREAAEAAILEMFTWPAGDFSFDVRGDLDPEDPQLTVSTGINAQYLAMEGLRLRDERGRDGAEGAAIVDQDAETNPTLEVSVQDSIFGEDLLETDADLMDSDDPLLALAALEDEPLEVDEEILAGPAATVGDRTRAATDEAIDATEVLVARAVERAAEDADKDVEARIEPERPAIRGAENHPTSTLPPMASPEKLPVVLIVPSVVVLEWAKAAIADDFARVHVFQQAEQGLARIRQYLIRGEVPLVVISTATRIDPLSGIHGLGDFAKRLKTQSPRLVLLGLAEQEDDGPAPRTAGLDRVLPHPARRVLGDVGNPEARAAAEALSRALLEAVGAMSGTGRSETPSEKTTARPSEDSEQLDRLEAAKAQLEESTSRGEVLPVILEFAAELFARVAILIVRESEVFAIAGRGLPALEVDPLESTSPTSISAIEPGWLAQVIETGRSQVACPQTAADRALIELLGGGVPEQAFIAPVESDSSVIALLYADQGPATEASPAAAMPETSSLEELLQHAGLALDRAALARALWEVDGDAR